MTKFRLVKDLKTNTLKVVKKSHQKKTFVLIKVFARIQTQIDMRHHHKLPQAHQTLQTIKSSKLRWTTTPSFSYSHQVNRNHMPSRSHSQAYQIERESRFFP